MRQRTSIEVGLSKVEVKSCGPTHKIWMQNPPCFLPAQPLRLRKTLAMCMGVLPCRCTLASSCQARAHAAVPQLPSQPSWDARRRSTPQLAGAAGPTRVTRHLSFRCQAAADGVAGRACTCLITTLWNCMMTLDTECVCFNGVRGRSAVSQRPQATCFRRRTGRCWCRMTWTRS